MKTITGYQRAVLTSLWIRQKPAMKLEEYIKKVCKQKGLAYKAPSKREER